MKKLIPLLFALCFITLQVSAQSDTTLVQKADTTVNHVVVDTSNNSLSDTAFVQNTDTTVNHLVDTAYNGSSDTAFVQNTDTTINHVIDTSNYRVPNPVSCSGNAIFVFVANTGSIILSPEDSVDNASWNIVNQQDQTVITNYFNFTYTQPLGSGTYTITHTVTNEIGCSDTASLTIAVPQAADTSTNICKANAAFHYTIDHGNATIIPEDSSADYYSTWMTHDDIHGYNDGGYTLNNSFTEFLPVGTYTITRLVTTNMVEGCYDSTSVTIVVAPDTTVAADTVVNTDTVPATAHLCNAGFNYAVNQDTLSCTDVDSSTGHSDYWGLYNVATGAFLYGNYIGHVFTIQLDPGTYTVQHTVYADSSDCEDNSTQTITVAPYAATCSNSISATQDSFTNNYFTFNTNQVYNGIGIATTDWAIDGTTVTDYMGSWCLYDSVAVGQHQVSCITTTTAGCTDTAYQTVTVQAPGHCGWKTSFTYAPVAQDNHTINFTASPAQPGLTYQWRFESQYYGDSILYGPAAPSYTYGYQGTYEVRLKVEDTATHCYEIDSEAVVVAPFSYDLQDSSSVKVYPTPTTGSTVNLELTLTNDASVQYVVSNIYGVVYQSSVQSYSGDNIITIPIQQLIAGQYFVDITYGNVHKHAVFQKL